MQMIRPGRSIRCRPLTALLLVLGASQAAQALPTRVHAIIAYEAARLPGVPAEIGSAAVVGSPDNPIGQDRDDGCRVTQSDQLDSDSMIVQMG